jgi:hypothetical protein
MVMLLDVACTQLALQVLLHAEHHGFPSLSADCSENRAIRRRNVKPTFSGYMGKWEAAQYPMHSEVKFLKLHEKFSLSSRNQNTMDRENPEAVFQQVTDREHGGRQALSDASDTIYAVPPGIEEVSPMWIPGRL